MTRPKRNSDSKLHYSGTTALTIVLTYIHRSQYDVHSMNTMPQTTAAPNPNPNPNNVPAPATNLAGALDNHITNCDIDCNLDDSLANRNTDHNTDQNTDHNLNDPTRRDDLGDRNIHIDDLDDPCNTSRNVNERLIHNDTEDGPDIPNELDIDKLYDEAILDDIRTSYEYIKLLSNATLQGSGLDSNTFMRLNNPLCEGLDLEDDPDLRFSLKMFLKLDRSSQNTYKEVRETILERYPDSGMLSYDQAKRRLEELSGVSQIKHDMCPETCLAYTGPFSDLEVCKFCGAHRYDQDILRKSDGRQKVPRQTYSTIPLGPQLQASWRDRQGAESMRYRERETKKLLAPLRASQGHLAIDDYDDFIHGADYLDAVSQGKIKECDTVLMFSIDGAQLYESKASDCWIYIWVILNHSPNVRYQKRYVLPGAIIPGPGKPRNMDSFLFPGLYHLAALQNEGLQIWDAIQNRVFVTHPFLAFATADAPALPYLNGLVGHHGRLGCRLFCGTPGRHRDGGSHYYPALLKPLAQYPNEPTYQVEGSDHADIKVSDVGTTNSTKNYAQLLQVVTGARNENQFKKLRLETGIAKPSLFIGLNSDCRLAIPSLFPTDIMHLASLNITDIMLSLWRGTLDVYAPDTLGSWPWCVLRGQVWRDHGKAVADARPYLPISFDRPPRNIAEKINSGYKSREFSTYFYGLGPALLLGILPLQFYTHYCKLVVGMRVMHQHRISVAQLQRAHKLLLEFVRDFELLYYQRKTTRIHFIRQSIHTLLHMSPEVFRVGPLGCHSQYTLE
jgi:hypothetical protein